MSSFAETFGPSGRMGRLPFIGISIVMGAIFLAANAVPAMDKLPGAEPDADALVIDPLPLLLLVAAVQTIVAFQRCRDAFGDTFFAKVNLVCVAFGFVPVIGIAGHIASGLIHSVLAWKGSLPDDERSGSLPTDRIDPEASATRLDELDETALLERAAQLRSIATLARAKPTANAARTAAAPPIRASRSFGRRKTVGG